jgi:two-component system NtrC family response regulator
MADDLRNFGPSSRLGTRGDPSRNASNLSKKILLVEGEESNARSLDRLLRKDGHNVYACHEVTEAVALFQKEQIDFVITEHSPRCLDGLDLLARVKQQNKKVPVLVMSSMQEKEPYIVAMNLGALDYLQEPVEYSNIQRLIKFS